MPSTPPAAKGLVVTFERSVAAEYVNRVRDAIMLIFGVVSVDVEWDTVQDQMNRQQVKADFVRRINQALEQEG